MLKNNNHLACMPSFWTVYSYVRELIDVPEVMFFPSALHIFCPDGLHFYGTGSSYPIGLGGKR